MLKTNDIYFSLIRGDLLLSHRLEEHYVPLSSLANFDEKKLTKIFMNLCRLVCSIRDHGIIAFEISPKVVYYNPKDGVILEFKGLPLFPDSCDKKFMSRWGFPYAPPEAWDPGIGPEWPHRVTSEKAAVWALGATMYEVNSPFLQDLEEYIDAMVHKYTFMINLQCPEALRLAIQEALHLSESDRSNLTELIQRLAEVKSGVRSSTVKETPIIRCQRCGEDLIARANSDERAADLTGLVFYWCPECARQNRQIQGEKISKYSLLKEIGRGWLGVLYLALYEPTGRVVALRKLRRHLIGPEWDRFYEDMKVIRDLIHPNLVRVLDLGEVQESRSQFVVSEFIPGGNLWSLVVEQERVLSSMEGVHLIQQLLDGVELMHQEGCVHRNIHPWNILLRRVEGTLEAKLCGCDLTLSYAVDMEMLEPDNVALAIIFKPPDLLKNLQLRNFNCDVYALGVSLYFLLTGSFPYDLPSQRKISFQDTFKIILEEEPIPIRERKPDIQESLATIVDKAVRKKEEERYQTVESFHEALLRTF